jgi:hypothetical protein
VWDVHRNTGGGFADLIYDIRYKGKEGHCD